MITKKAGISEIAIWLRERFSIILYSLIKETCLCAQQDWFKAHVSVHGDTTGKDSETLLTADQNESH